MPGFSDGTLPHFPMKPISFFAVSLVCLLSFGSFHALLNAAEGRGNPLFTDTMIQRFGLTRAWFNQVQIDPKQHKVLHALEEGRTLFLVSDDAKIHALDAETGQSLWVQTFGEKGMSYLEPAVNSRVVAVLNGLELFIFNRKNGKQVFQAHLPGAAATTCELSEHYVYVPLMNGRMIAFPLEDHTPIYNEETAVEKPAAKAPDDAAPTDSSPESGREDAVLAKIVKSFTETKQSVMAEPEPSKPEPEVVLRGPLGIPMVCQSFGNILCKPLVPTQLITYAPNGRPEKHQEISVWITDRGSLFAAGIEAFSQEKFDLRYAVDSAAEAYFLDKTRIAQREWDRKNELVARPTANQCEPPVYLESNVQEVVVPSLVVVGSRSGYVFAVRDRIGEVCWQFVVNGPVLERIAVVGKDVYCPTFPGGMHALDLTDGKEQWFMPGIRKFVAASIKRLYVLDANANLIVLNRQTGTPIYSFSVRQIDQCLFNIETDRIYFINESGLIQCLKEQRYCGDSECRGKTICPHTEMLAQPTQHRLSAQQYAAALKGRPTPKLYWMSGAEEAEPDAAPEAMPDEGDDSKNPFGDSPKKKSGEDGNLEADTPTEPATTPQPAGQKKEKKEDENDPFN